MQRVGAAARLAARSYAGGACVERRCFHASSVRQEVTHFKMPAMSPTMTEGGIAQWKKKEGEAFSAGDVLLEIETDKATIDVEAPEDGVMGKILAPDGSKNVPVGKIIALVAEEGDDISNLEAPKEDDSPPPEAKKPEAEERKAAPSEPSPTSTSAKSTTQPPSHDLHITHSRPLFPSVLRLLQENGIENTDKIKGSGVRGMLTKGDVLAFLGKASSPLGTFKEAKKAVPELKKTEEYKPLDGPALRRHIVSSLLQISSKSRSIPPLQTSADFDSIISDYLPPTQGPQIPVIPTAAPPPKMRSSTGSYFDGLL